MSELSILSKRGGKGMTMPPGPVTVPVSDPASVVELAP